MIPLSIPILFPDVPIPIDQIPAQKGTDLQYIRQLADEVGYVFYIEPGPGAGHQRRLLRAARSRSACRSRRSTSTWMRTPTSSR